MTSLLPYKLFTQKALCANTNIYRTRFVADRFEYPPFFICGFGMIFRNTLTGSILCVTQLVFVIEVSNVPVGQNLVALSRSVQIRKYYF